MGILSKEEVLETDEHEVMKAVIRLQDCIINDLNKKLEHLEELLAHQAQILSTDKE